MTAKRKAYARAGVDVDLGNKLKRGIQSLVRQTHGPQVLGKIGGFGGLFRASFPGIREPVLVASIDGVGTKLKIWVHVPFFSWITLTAENSNPACSNNCSGVFRAPVDLQVAP